MVTPISASPLAPNAKRHLRTALLAVLAIPALAASCTAETDKSAVAISISPSPAKVLTCESATFTAKVTGTSDTAATFSVDPKVGSIDASSGVYTAPTQTPTPGNVTVTATSHADSGKSSRSTVTLATAFPNAGVAIAGSVGSGATMGTGIYTHAMAASGSRVYATWPDDSSPSVVGLKVARSDDGGVTWQSAVSAVTANVVTAGAIFECPAIAIDAGNPDVVYVVGLATATTDLSASLATGSLSGEANQILATSTDGGKTFTSHVMHIGASGGICGDVASPAPNTVVVESPGTVNCDMGSTDSRDLFFWVDANQGSGFATGKYSTEVENEYFADGYVESLNELKQGDHCSVDHLWPENDGGSDSAGDATESPRLFTDGAGRLCLSYIGYQLPSNGTMLTNAYVQCSSDIGQTFSPALKLDQSVGPDPSSASGASGPNHAAAIVWTTGGPPSGALYIATSTDDGKTFGTAATIPTYTIPGDPDAAYAFNPTVAYDASGILWLSYRASDNGNGLTLIVDKSCDGGKTWSGAVPVSLDGSLNDLKWPSFALTPGAAPHLVGWAGDHISAFSLAGD